MALPGTFSTPGPRAETLPGSMGQRPGGEGAEGEEIRSPYYGTYDWGFFLAIHQFFFFFLLPLFCFGRTEPKELASSVLRCVDA
jgi:hypothetical protein